MTVYISLGCLCDYKCLHGRIDEEAVLIPWGLQNRNLAVARWYTEKAPKAWPLQERRRGQVRWERGMVRWRGVHNASDMQVRRQQG